MGKDFKDMGEEIEILGKIFTPAFHHPEDCDGVKPKELSPFVGPKSKISEKLDQN